MEQLLKPERFDVLPTVAEADAKWIHWKRTFTNFTNKICDGTQESKLSLLCNYISAAVFLHIAEATCYSDAISILDSTYLVKKNDTFARHLLAIRNQQVSETVNDFLQALNQLSRNCDFRAVTAEQYRGEFIRDAFIRGLKYGNIRDHLLGNASSNNLEDAVNQAKTLELLESSSIKAHHKPQEKDVIQSHQIACVKIANAYHYPQHISSIADVNQNHQNFFNTKNAFPEQHEISTSVYNNQENFCSLVNVFEKHPKSSNTTENGIQLPCRMVNVNSGRQNNYNSENVVHDPPQRETQCKKRTKCTVNINFGHQNVNRTENVFQVPPEITNATQCNKKPIIIKEHQLIQDGNCFKCGVCEKRFESKRGLRRHLHVHEEGYVKVNHYLNKMTEEERKEKRSLRRHMEVHSDEKSYFTCEFCDKKFRLRVSLHKHFLTHTKKVTKKKTKTAELIESSSNERENSHESESY
ncbi:hypothetical protein JTE90_016738 [Oedothorax gibbosus]|uniref:C2H2-type domain-containing protein n=1 Tax=Oedothorax gibbosus TaxID=931172 RepID=A0AAV6U1I1_9ARAC|nr:hypothetical protein JTE90_016738 [Oedothorax gibbosus]